MGCLTLKIDYSEGAPLMNGLPNTIAQYDIGAGKRSKADNPTSSTKLAIRIKNDINGIPLLEKVEMTELWTEEEKIPVKTSGGKAAAKPKEEEKKAEAAQGATEGEAPAAGEEEKKEEA